MKKKGEERDGVEEGRERERERERERRRRRASLYLLLVVNLQGLQGKLMNNALKVSLKISLYRVFHFIVS